MHYLNPDGYKSMQGISAYRRLLRCANTLFKGDNYSLGQARKQLKDEFMKNKYVSDKVEIGILKSNAL